MSSSTYALRGLRSDFDRVAKQLKQVSSSVEKNTLEFKKINDKIAKNEIEKKRNEPKWNEVKEITDKDRYPLVEESQNIPDLDVEYNLKKLDIL